MVKSMEDHKTEIIIILAGYQAEMEKFLQTNPGLRSRFPIHIDFADYSRQELMQIAEQMCVRRQYQLAGDAKMRLARMLNPDELANGAHFGNARTVRNLIEKAIRRQAVRLVARAVNSREELITIEAADLTEVQT